MRSFAVDALVPLIAIPFRAFLHNLTDVDQAATLHACYRALRPRGRLAINVFNPDLSIIERWTGRSVRHYEPFGRAGRIEAHHEFRPAARIVSSRLRWREGARMRRGSLALRYVTREEMEVLMVTAGFHVDALYGDCLGAPFGPHSTELVWVARRS